MSQPKIAHKFRVLEVNGGRVLGQKPFSRNPFTLHLPRCQAGYADAQIDDCLGRRKDYPWQPGTMLSLRARFSHEREQLIGTAGFGFWNAPFGDPTRPWPALPQAAWFFFGSPPNDFPLAQNGPGRGWFASTLDATTRRAISLAPFALKVLLLNQVSRLRHRLWPWVQKQLQISFQPIQASMTDWHDYRLSWRTSGCDFWLDGRLVHQTSFSPRGPLGFVCWIDNQYLVATARGRFSWGSLPIPDAQFLEVQSLQIEAL